MPRKEGFFLEVKSRTWSRRDAEDKAGQIVELLELGGVHAAKPIRREYPDLVR